MALPKKFVFIQAFFFTVGSKQKKGNKEYNDTFITFKSQLYSKPGSSIFLLFESWNLVLYHHVWVK